MTLAGSILHLYLQLASNLDNGIVIKVNFLWFPWGKKPQN